MLLDSYSLVVVDGCPWRHGPLTAYVPLMSWDNMPDSVNKRRKLRTYCELSDESSDKTDGDVRCCAEAVYNAF